MNLMTSLLFYSHHSLMLVGQAPIRWWSGSTFSPLKLEVMFGRWALSPSLAFFWKSLWVPPWCSAILRGGGTLPIPFILLSGKWWWLSMTSTAWPALDLRGPSLVWMVCQACSWASTCWGGSTPLRPSAISNWCRITCSSYRELGRSVSVWLGISFSTCWGLNSLPMVGKRCLWGG